MTLVKSNNITPSEQNPFADDCLGREKVAEYLTPIIASIKQPFVIGLHSPYGTGKTHFVERWQVHLANEGYRTVVFNAWKTDFSSDVLSAFIATLKSQLATEENGVEAELVELAKKAGGFFRHKALPILAKGLGRKLVGQEAVQEFLDNVDLGTDEVSDALSSTAIDAVNAQIAATSAMDSFKNYLEKIAKELTANAEDENKRKLIIVVDELDRCRPTYAIEVLECIKHLFSVPGVVFILSVDNKQLKNSIASVYGPNLDADGYLRRFIDWSFRLPEPSHRAYSRLLTRQFGLPDIEGYNDIQAKIELTFSSMCAAYKMSLRDQEQVFTHLNLALRSISTNHVSFGYPIAFFTALRFADNEQYNRIVSSKSKVATTAESFVDGLKNKLVDPPYAPDWERFLATLQAWMHTEDSIKEVFEIRDKAQEIIEKKKNNERPLRDTDPHVLELRKSEAIINQHKQYMSPINFDSVAKATYEVLEGAELYQ